MMNKEYVTINQFEIYIFLFLTIIFPLIDTANGFFITAGLAIPIGQVYRSCFVLYVGFEILTHQMPKTIFTILVGIFITGNIILVILQAIILQNPANWIVSDLNSLIKYLLWLLIPYFSYQRKQELAKVDLSRFFRIINGAFILCLLIPYALGQGTYTYTASAAGFKGFFYAQNDLSCVFIVLVSLACAELLQNIKNKWSRKTLMSVLIFFGDLICILLIGMKTGIIYEGLILVYLLLSLMLSKHYYSVENRGITFAGCLLFLLVMVFKGLGVAAEMLSQTWIRLTYFYHLYNGNLIQLITSSRSEYLKASFAKFTADQHRIFVLLCGQGPTYRVENFGRLGLSEMDFFDLFFNYGLIGVILFLIVITFFLNEAFKEKNFSIYSFCLIVILIYSFFAGYVLYSALSATIFGLIIGSVYLNHQD